MQPRGAVGFYQGPCLKGNSPRSGLFAEGLVDARVQVPKTEVFGPKYKAMDFGTFYHGWVLGPSGEGIFTMVL